jgi:general secretion pathway protein G
MNFFSRIVAVLRRRSLQSGQDQLGMTLIEIMVVVAIIGLMMGGVGVYAYGQYKKAQLKRARADILNLKPILQQYGLDHQGECPKDLNVLHEEKLIEKEPKDPWGQSFTFKCPGEHDTELGDIVSKGPDKKEGTEDDINSWDL